ncbi:hypothetical protein BDB00DRAFT_880100 [Zychaea mexicana]|uniref:uncharacterized protein n=1 Tax=Zychaea mexicana TaxID=64656 RepID=UPI0022FDDD97|nr:uncharacterized protein BDB00DRAFT_880100 [Zychaea mexicana]KAI9470458.1 hypothetical protein BDB00DRAFT_880100 [Zychaea mexicana]
MLSQSKNFKKRFNEKGDTDECEDCDTTRVYCREAPELTGFYIEDFLPLPPPPPPLNKHG